MNINIPRNIQKKIQQSSEIMEDEKFFFFYSQTSTIKKIYFKFNRKKLNKISNNLKPICNSDKIDYSKNLFPR